MRMGMAVFVGTLGLSSLLLSGCVLREQYEAEQARAVNFQRLLAQEEKRTGELDSELKRVRQEANDLEARNRELSTQLQAVRERAAEAQEESTRGKGLPGESAASALGGGLSEEKGLGEAAEPGEPAASALGGGFPEEKSLLGEAAEPGKPVASALGGKSPIHHVVRHGETLYRLSRQYGVSVAAIKQWNNLKDNLIAVGQQLIVGYE